MDVKALFRALFRDTEHILYENTFYQLEHLLCLELYLEIQETLATLLGTTSPLGNGSHAPYQRVGWSDRESGMK